MSPNSPTSVPQPEDRATISCLYCDKLQEVSRRAVSVTCKFCNRSLKLTDEPIKAYTARRNLDTCGVVTVEKKGQIVTDRILCGGVVVRGKVKGAIVSRGPVLVGPEAEIRGDVKAPTIAIGAGAILDGNYEIGNLDRVGRWLASRPPGASQS
jgi:ADP-glucose pyrophosphorylase